MAEARDRPEIVRDEHDRLLRRAELADLCEALVLEVLVANGEHLVDEQHVGVEMHRDAEPKAHVHAARVRLHRGVEEPADVGELLDRRHDPVHLLAREPQERSIQIRVLAPAEVRMEAGTDLEERGHPAVDLERATRRFRGPRQELEECRFPGAVRADHAERLARLDREAHVAQRLDPLRRRVLPQEGLLERARALAAELVRLGDVIRADGGHLRAVTM